MSTVIEKAILLMKENGYKNTPKRREILEIVAEANRFVTAKYVYEKLVPKHKYTKLSYETVYRNLYSFVEHGILEMSDKDGEKVFLLHCSENKHHHHFICDMCGSIKELSNCPIKVFSKQLDGYVVLNHRFEVTGLCPECSTKQEAEAIKKENTQEKHCDCGHH